MLFDNFGPYHIARLSAAANVLNLVAIEVTKRSSVYDWQPAESVPFERITLVQDLGSSIVDYQVLRSRIYSVLLEREIQVLAIPGWSGKHSIAALQTALELQIPVVLMSESQERDFDRTRLKEFVKKRYLRLCSSSLVGGSMHRDYLQKLGMPLDRIFMGYDVVDNDFFSDSARIIRARLKVGKCDRELPENYFLVSARFIEKKNLDRLIFAFSEFRNKFSGTRMSDTAWHLVVLGDGSLRRQLEKQVNDLGLKDVVHMPGFIQYKDLPEFYARASVFIHPSTIEQWGLVVNEALASGLPVLVSSQCGCASELVQSGLNGFVFEPTDMERLSDLMLKLAGDAQTRKSMGACGKKIVQDWGPERFAEGLSRAVTVAVDQTIPKPSLFDRAVLGVLGRI